MKVAFTTLLIFLNVALFSQNATVSQANFCASLNKVFALGRNDNFSSYDGTSVKKSAFLVVPGYSISLEGFPINYADKDHRFVARANLNLDSLSSLNKLEEFKIKVAVCLDSTQWQLWLPTDGDDAATPFFKELKQAKAITKDFTLTLAVVSVATNLYSINMYVKRN